MVIILTEDGAKWNILLAAHERRMFKKKNLPQLQDTFVRL